MSASSSTAVARDKQVFLQDTLLDSQRLVYLAPAAYILAAFLVLSTAMLPDKKQAE